MKLKIISDGTVMGTTLIDSETGQHVPGVTKLSWSADVNNPSTTTLQVTIVDVPVEVDGQWQIKETTTAYRYERKLK